MLRRDCGRGCAATAGDAAPRLRLKSALFFDCASFQYAFAFAFAFVFVFATAFRSLSATAVRVFVLRLFARRGGAKPKTCLEAMRAPSRKVHCFHFDVAEVWNER